MLIKIISTNKVLFGAEVIVQIESISGGNVRKPLLMWLYHHKFLNMYHR